MNGYIKLHRQLLNWQWYGVPVVKDLFLHFLLRANLSDGFYSGTLVKRGQLVIGRKDLAETLGYTEMQIRSAIDKLRTTNEITTKTTNKGTVITIVNWDFYQSNEQENNQQINHQNNHQLTNKQPASNHQITTYKEEKEEKKNKNISNRGHSFLKPSIQEIQDFINEHGYYVNPEYFYNYYESNGWMVGKNKMKDWKATVRMWSSREYRNNSNNRKQSRSFMDVVIEEDFNL